MAKSGFEAFEHGDSSRDSEGRTSTVTGYIWSDGRSRETTRIFRIFAGRFSETSNATDCKKAIGMNHDAATYTKADDEQGRLEALRSKSAAQGMHFLAFLSNYNYFQ